MAFIVPGTQEGKLEGACTLGDNLQHLQRITDFNTLLAKANQSIATASDGNQLLKDFCELAVRYAHFDLAAVARPDKSGWFQFPVAAGAVSFMEGLQVCIDPERPEGRGSLARVWKDQQPFFIEDSLEHPILELWRERYRRFSFKFSAVLPIQTLRRKPRSPQ
jgi:GAF domain-containing protein